MLALVKLKTEFGRARFTISRFKVFSIERISSRFGLEINPHKRWRDSTISSHSARAAMGSEGRRYSNNVLSADNSSSSSRSSSFSCVGISLTRRPWDV